MGTWSFAVTGSDDFQDCYSDILKEISKLELLDIVLDNVYRNYLKCYSDDLFALNAAVYALAFAAWEYGYFDNKYKEKAIELVNSGNDIDCLRNLGVEEQDLDKRKQELLKFIEKIGIPNKKPKKN